MAMQEKISLDSMITRLSKEGMPVFAGTSRLIQSLSSDDKTSMNELTWAILKDSSMTSRLLRLANSQFFNRDHRRVSTVSRAVLQLGFNTVKSVCIFSMIVEDMLKGVRQDRVSREMVRSFHAAVQARNLMAAKGDANPEEVFIAALLHRIGHIAFWIFGDELADQLDEAIKSRPGIPQESLEKEVLGFSLKNLSLGLAEEWGLGGLVQTSLSGADSDRRVKGVQIGHAIAMGSEEGWESPRMKTVMGAISQFLNVDREGTERLVKESAEEASRAAKDYGLEPHTRLIPVQAGDKREAPAPAPEVVASHQPDTVLQIDVLSELSSLTREKQVNLNLFLSTLIEGIHRGVGMDRVIFAIMSPDKRLLCGRYALGWEQPRIEKFQLSTKPIIPNIISVILSEKEALWANGSAARGGTLVTEEVKNVMSGKLFFIAPILIKGNVLGIICADRSLSKRDLDQKSFCCFSYFVHAANALLGSVY